MQLPLQTLARPWYVLGFFSKTILNCTNCDKELERSDHYFSSNVGGFCCTTCFESKRLLDQSIKVTVGQQLILRTIARKNYKDLINLNLSEKEINNCRKLIQNSIRDIIGVQLKTVKFSDL